MTNKLGSANPDRIPKPKKKNLRSKEIMSYTEKDIKNMGYKDENKECPQCKSKNVVPIMYGLIDSEYYEKNKDKYENIHLGGCMLSDEDTYCNDCENKFVNMENEDKEDN